MAAAYSPRLDAAVAFAAESFRFHLRKGTRTPYLTHLFAVMALVGEYGGDEDQLVAALLHDFLEDVPGASQEALAARFGARPARIVAALSDAVTQPKPPWRERKLRHLAQLRDEPGEVKLVSAADKLHNASTIRWDLRRHGPGVWSRFSGGRDGSLWYYEEVVESLGASWSHPLHDRLAEEVARMQEEARA